MTIPRSSLNCLQHLGGGLTGCTSPALTPSPKYAFHDEMRFVHRPATNALAVAGMATDTFPDEPLRLPADNASTAELLPAFRQDSMHGIRGMCEAWRTVEEARDRVWMVPLEYSGRKVAQAP